MARYRKIGGGEPTMNRNSDGNWYMCKGHSGCWYKLASGDDLPPTAGWTTGSEGRSPAPTLRLFSSAAEAKRAIGHHSDRTGGAAIGDLVMVLPSARKKDGCVRPGEVGKFIKDDHDGQPFKVEKLDKSNSSYYYDIDTKISYRIGSNWSFSANYDFIHRSETLGGAYKDTDTRLTLGLTYHR